MRCDVFIHDRHVAAYELPKSFFSFPTHTAFFSPLSGRVWAQFFYEGADGWTVEYVLDENEWRANQLAAGCHIEVPGSLIWTYSDEVPDEFPPSLVEREFNLHVNYARRMLWHGAGAAASESSIKQAA